MKSSVIIALGFGLGAIMIWALTMLQISIQTTSMIGVIYFGGLLVFYLIQMRNRK